jgi:molybdopterin-guanine dinucleotide biosynthesis protein A
MNLSAVLLAGGESRRMGEDKAALLFHGTPLWQVQLNCLRKLQPAELLLSARTDPHWRPGDIRFVADATPSRGPLSGLAAALEQIGTSHLVALAIDMPFMTHTYLQTLCHRMAPGCGVMPMIADSAEPLAAIYPAEADVDLARVLQGNDFSLQELTSRLVAAGKLRVVAVPATEQNLFRNLNRAADLE